MATVLTIHKHRHKVLESTDLIADLINNSSLKIIKLTLKRSISEPPAERYSYLYISTSHIVEVY